MTEKCGFLFGSGCVEWFGKTLCAIFGAFPCGGAGTAVEIPGAAFYNCHKLEILNLPKKLPCIGNITWVACGFDATVLTLTAKSFS
jgi:hypothetical protein